VLVAPWHDDKQRALAAGRRALQRPIGCGGNRICTATELRGPNKRVKVLERQPKVRWA
jgi:hypothetical protein